MRVLFLTVPDRSHLYVAAPLAWALRSAGHEVRVAGPPELADVIGATGLTGVAVGAAAPEAITSQMNDAEPTTAPARPDPRAVPATPRNEEYAADDPCGEFDALVRDLLPMLNPNRVFEDLVEHARTWRPDLVVWDMLTYAGPVAAHAAGAAHARLLLGNDGLGQLRAHALARRAATGEDPMREWLGPKLEAVGSTFAEDAVVGDWTLDPMPAWTHHPDGIPFVPFRHVPFNGPSIVPDWLRTAPSRPRVCLTLGNSHREAGRVEASAPALMEAVDGLDVEVVATLGPDQLSEVGTLPANVRATSFVPLNELLPTCSALVHHGGAGTFAGGVEHGVPQVLVPSTWWSERWYGPVAMAHGVQDQGAGLYPCTTDDLTPTRLREALVRVLEDDSFRQNARKLAADFATMPSPHDLVPTLERLTHRHRRR